MTGSSPLSRRYILVAIVALFLFYYFGFHPTLSGAAEADSARRPLDRARSGRQGLNTWYWNATMDRDNHLLTATQCSQAFPELYHDIDRAVSYWSGRTKEKSITPASISLDWAGDGGLTAMIYDQQLYITYSRGINHFPHWFQRHRATLLEIHRAISTAPEPVPNIEFSIRINDVVALDNQHPDTTVWAYSRDIHNPVHDQLWTIPDFNFWSYPGVAGSFKDFQHKALQLGGNFASKIPEVVWRGTISYNPELRRALLRQAQGQPWSAIASVDQQSSDQAERISIEDHCRYKLAVHTEGTTWSGRLKYLLSCNSVVLIHPLRYMTHIYHLLRSQGPDQNYVAVEADFKDLPGKVAALLEDQKRATRIADSAARTFRDRYATPAAQTCYFRRLFAAWRSVSFEPDPYKYIQDGDGTTRRVRRGMTLEEYL